MRPVFPSQTRPAQTDTSTLLQSCQCMASLHISSCFSIYTASPSLSISPFPLAFHTSTEVSLFTTSPAISASFCLPHPLLWLSPPWDSGHLVLTPVIPQFSLPYLFSALHFSKIISSPFKIYLFIWLHRVLVSACGITDFSLVAARRLSFCSKQASLPCGMWDLRSPTRD